MSIKLMSKAWELVRLNQGQKLLLIALCDNANDEGVCWPSIPNIAKRCCSSERSTLRHIAVFEKMGLLTIKTRPGRSSVYTVFPPMVSTNDKLSPLTICHLTPDNLSDHYKEEPSKNHQGTEEGFASFWDAFPQNRKGSKGKCLAIWKKKRLDEKKEEIIAHVKAMSQTDQWRKENGKFSPLSMTYLNKEPWDGAEEPTNSRADLFKGCI